MQNLAISIVVDEQYHREIPEKGVETCFISLSIYSLAWGTNMET